MYQKYAARIYRSILNMHVQEQSGNANKILRFHSKLA